MTLHGIFLKAQAFLLLVAAVDPGAQRSTTFFHFFHGLDSGQILATSHNLTPNGGLVISPRTLNSAEKVTGGLVREIPLFQGNLGW